LRRQGARLEELARRTKSTVLMAVFNEERFIASAIESVFQQTEQAFRLLILDDGSSDRTSEIAQSYLKDSRVRLFRQWHQGPSAALQKGLHKVETPYLLRLNGDDEHLPSAVEALQEVIERLSPEVALCYANHILIDEATGAREIRRGHFLRSRYDVLRFVGPMAPRPYRVSASRALGGWTRDDPYRGRFLEDRLLEYKLAGRFSFRWLDRQPYLRRFHGENQSAVDMQKYARLKKWAVRKSLKDWDAPYRAKFHSVNSRLHVKLKPQEISGNSPSFILSRLR
jgi:glycosyltransferase involved in cell wall biosynthesis